MDILLFPVPKTHKVRGEYSLADRAGLGLQDLPLVLGDPESGGGEKDMFARTLKSLFYLS